ncbi:MAG: glycoside hydrolase family 2 protein, partial [Bacteroidota bacterium]
FKLMFDSTVFFSGRELLKKGINVIRIDFDMTNPKRWWPNGFGAPTRYNLGYQVWFAGRKEAEGHQKIGLRTVELVQTPDSIGTSFYLNINDVPVFIRGANYIPMDNFPSRVTDSMYTALIMDVDAANMNMLRVWGGGIYENDIFYDLCDEKGIMVWQDFMFANAMYPEDNQFLNSVRDEVIQNIVRLRHHPSIVLWCGNNEIEEGWLNWGWVKEYGYNKQDSSRIYRNYRKIFHEFIPYALLRHDTLRPYIPTSPMHGWGREESLKEGDFHYWGVWWGKEPFEKYNEKVGRFVSEYGFQGFPDYTTIEKFTFPADRQPGSNAMKAHQKSSVGYETIQEYMEHYYKVPTDFSMYGYVSQLLQADGLKTAIDAHRRAKPTCMGTLYWQLNDSWPVISWSTRDYFGKKKASYWAAYHAYRDFFVSPVMEGDRLKVYATFDEPENQQAELRVVLVDFDGKVLWQEVKTYDFSAKKTEIVTDTNLSSYLAGVDKSNLFIYAQIKNILGIRASNLNYFVPPKEMKLEKAPIEITVQKSQGGYDIELYTTKLAKGVYLSTPVAGEFTDNYFDLMPFEVKWIKFVTQETPISLQDSIKVISLIDSYPE